jgi:hypothetical protein
MKNKQILTKSSMVGSVKKRGENIKIWGERIVVTTDHYVYFYRESNDLKHEYSLFMKDAVIQDVSDSVGEKYALSVANKFGNFMISFQSALLKTTWKEEFIKMERQLMTEK